VPVEDPKAEKAKGRRLVELRSTSSIMLGGSELRGGTL